MDRDGTLLPQDLPDVRSELTGSLPQNLDRSAFMETEGGTYFWCVVCEACHCFQLPAAATSLPGQAAAIICCAVGVFGIYSFCAPVQLCLCISKLHASGQRRA